MSEPSVISRSKLRQKLERSEMQKIRFAATFFLSLLSLSFVLSLQQNSLVNFSLAPHPSVGRTPASLVVDEKSAWRKDQQVLQELSKTSRRHPASLKSSVQPLDRLRFEDLRGNYSIGWDSPSQITSLKSSDVATSGLLTYQDFQNLLNKYPLFFRSGDSDDSEIHWLAPQKAELSLLKSGRKQKTYELEMNDQLEILSLKLVSQ